MMTKKKCGAIILAAGSGTRMKQDVPKQFLTLADCPLLLHSLRVFAGEVDEMVLVTGEAYIGTCRELIQKEALPVPVSVAAGGKERYDSSICGLKYAADWEYVMIHDAARACVTPEVIRRSLESAQQFGSGVAAVAAKDTIKRVDADGFVSETLDRASLRIIQTPQTFRTQDIVRAYQIMEETCTDKHTVTDDAMVLETFGGMKVHLSEGSYENIKVTTPEDLLFAEAILKARGGRQ